MSIFHLAARTIINKDWATVLFIIAFIIIAANKNVFSIRFQEFMRLGYSDKYIKIYKDSNHLFDWFTISMFVIQIISYTFFAQLLLSFFNYTTPDNYITFIQLITFFVVFVLSKFLIEKIIANIINIESFVEQFNLVKINYRAFLGIIILPVNLFLYYSNIELKEIFYTILVIFLIYNLFTYFFLIKNYQNIILGKLFYFILYLCTLEIAPYYFMYYWVTKN